MRGLSYYPATVDPQLVIREDAARAYYWPITTRKNLHVLLHTAANKITWKDCRREGNVVASGIEVTAYDGSIQTYEAKREVILSAGSLRSPGLLELSGVGNPE